jgi:hypothetical protein
MAVDKNKFKVVTQLVIDKLEGGYYNPEWHSTGDSRYGSSGETMFGIDRVAGGSINNTTAGKQFWGIIDKVKTKPVWKWNYLGGADAPQLKEHVVDIMYPVYENNAKTHLSSEAKAIVDSDSRLLFNFIYASWNGSGWFKKFASDINKAVASGVTDRDKLVQVTLDSREDGRLLPTQKNPNPKPSSLIQQGGRKIAGFIGELKDVSTKAEKVVKKNPLITALITSLLIVSGYLIYKYTIKK